MEFISRFFWQINKNSQVFIACRLKRFKIGNGQLPLLMLLFNYKECLNQEEISQLLNIDKGATARAVGKLLKEGFINRSPDAKDNRMQRISLSEKARRMKDDFFNIADEWQNILLKGVSRKDKEYFLEILKKIKKNSQNFRD